MKIPITILAYNRPHYFILLAQSLKAQVSEDRDLYIFIDQPRDEHSIPYVYDTLKFAKEYFPKAQFFLPPNNLGICFMTKWIREFMFDKFDRFHFLEDDCILSKNYIANLDNISDTFLNNEEVGMVNCFGEFHREKNNFNWLTNVPEVIKDASPFRTVSDIEIQTKNSDKIIPMHHNWSYSIYKRAYEKALPLMEKYYNVVGNDYVRRPHQKIYEMLGSEKIKNAVSSQDSVFCSALSRAGISRISTFPSCMKQIGEWGLHTRPNNFKDECWNELPMFENIIYKNNYDNSQMNQILKIQQDFYLQ